MSRRRSQGVHLLTLSRRKQEAFHQAVDVLTELVERLQAQIAAIEQAAARSESARKANRTRKAAAIAGKGGLANGPVEVETPSIAPPPAK